MNGDYFFYIACSYGVCLAALGGLVLSSMTKWRQVRDETKDDTP